MALRNLKPEGVFLFRDNSLCRAESLALALLGSSRSLLVLTITGREKVLRRRFTTLCDSATFVELERGASLEKVHGQIMSSSPSAFLLDCAELFIELYGVDSVSAFLFRLKEKCAVMTICSESSVPDEQFRRLVSVADTVITLETHEGVCIADIMTYKKNGKHANMKETFSISEDLKISSKKYVPSESIQAQLNNPRTEILDMEPELGEKERDAKQNLNLPFTSVTKQSDLVSLRLADRKVRVGGQIIYTPDKEDDLDDSDPDDDLNL
ncbi:unnamed protein product [Cylicocyclus nassatus]|uniref:Elongator complex protein 5 n=1 Tax=Cylicocyclus nassatus TaxID=53992 RepID=A0AA36H8Z4_CYLNA|nr:unnamed protein product [Cylicocyclus nassatus]